MTGSITTPWNAATYRPDPLVVAGCAWARREGIPNHSIYTNRVGEHLHVLNAMFDHCALAAIVVIGEHVQARVIPGSTCSVCQPPPAVVDASKEVEQMVVVKDQFGDTEQMPLSMFREHYEPFGWHLTDSTTTTPQGQTVSEAPGQPGRVITGRPQNVEIAVPADPFACIPGANDCKEENAR